MLTGKIEILPKKCSLIVDATNLLTGVLYRYANYIDYNSILICFSLDVLQLCV